MCLVALAWNTHPRWRLLIVGNRDEFIDRPTAALAHWHPSPHPVLAGRDLRSGGSWMGLAHGGRVAVVTNVRDPTARQSGASRGELVADYLSGTRTVAAALRSITADAGSFPPFNLLLADDRECHHPGNHPPSHRPLLPGVHGLSNGALNAPWPKTVRLKNALGHWLELGSENLDPLWHALADQTPVADEDLPDTGVELATERRLSTAFITGEHYGTRASTIIGVDHDGSGFIAERRFGAHGTPLGYTRLTLMAPG